MNYLPQARLENVVIQDAETELLIYDLVSNKALCLNETSKIIWQACDGKTTFDDLRSKTNLAFSDELIWLALDQLKRDKLLDKSVEIKSKFHGLTRREVVKRVGLASMVMLPIISSIVAPTAVNAQSGSCVQDGATCNFSNFGQSNCCPNFRCNVAGAPFSMDSCSSCLGTGEIYGICPLGVCGACNNAPAKNLCCDTAPSATNNGLLCACG